MIKNGYYHPDEVYRDLTGLDVNGKVVGKAQSAVCMGNRTGGKTVGHATQMIQNYLIKNERCMLLSRFLTTFKENKYMSGWWNKTLTVDDDRGIVRKFTDEHKIEFTDKAMLVDGDIMCYGEAISQSKEVKDQGSYNHCTNILLDEAFQLGESYLQIKGRSAMSRIFEIWQTVGRGYPKAEALTHMIFIANVSDMDNWVFNDLELHKFVRLDTKYTIHNGIIVEKCDNKAARKRVELSLMGRIMMNSVSGREYYDAAQNNKYTDNRAFVKAIGLDFKKLKVQLIIREYCLGVFQTDDGFHISTITPDSRARKICNDVKNHTPDVYFEPLSEWTDMLAEAYRKNRVTFQTLESKSLFFAYTGIS